MEWNGGVVRTMLLVMLTWMLMIWAGAARVGARASGELLSRSSASAAPMGEPVGPAKALSMACPRMSWAWPWPWGAAAPTSVTQMRHAMANANFGALTAVR